MKEFQRFALNTQGFRRYLSLLFFSISECMSQTSFEGTKVAPALQLIVGSHVDNGAIVVTAEGKEMAIGESLEMYADC